MIGPWFVIEWISSGLLSVRSWFARSSLSTLRSAREGGKAVAMLFWRHRGKQFSGKWKIWFSFLNILRTAPSHFPVFSLGRYGVTLHPSYCRNTTDSPDEASMNPKKRQQEDSHMTCNMWAVGKLGSPLRSEYVNSLGNLWLDVKIKTAWEAGTKV